AGLTVLEQVAEALVGLLARAEARELAHRPQPSAVHRRVDAAGEGVAAGAPDRVLGAADPRGEVLDRIELAHGLAGERAELPLGCVRVRLARLRRLARQGWVARWWTGLGADGHGVPHRRPWRGHRPARMRSRGSERGERPVCFRPPARGAG